MSFAEGLVGIVLDDRYRLDALLGEGGMGSVFRATHLAMERKVAVKLLKPHLTSDQTQLERFAREARATMKVDSPHAVKVTDFGVTPHSDYYMVLEYLDGRTVQRELDVDGVFTPARTVHIARQALHALGAAHRQGIVHRDVKPDNLLLLRVGADPDYTKMLDFGVAKLMEGAAATERSRMALTQQGMVFGTPEFMSPEQACGLPLDGRSDLYALAATMYAMLTGRGLFDVVAALGGGRIAGRGAEGRLSPIDGGRTAGRGAEGRLSPIDWLMHHGKTPPPHQAAAEPGLAAYPELDAALQRCLAKDRADRPASAEAMEQLLASVAPTLTRPPGAPPAERAARSSLFSASSYFSSLPSMDLPSQRASAPTIGSPSLTDHPASSIAGMVEPDDSVAVIIAAQRRRGRMIMISALAVVGVLAVVAVVVFSSVSRGPARAGSTLPKPVVTDSRPDAALAVAVTDAAIANAPVDASPPDASVAAVKPTRTDKHLVAKKPNPHLEAAEDAATTGNRLRQLAEADLALRSDPKSARAKYLLGDALVATGDLDRGCKYLLALKRDSRAAARARAAGCGQSVD